MVNKKRWRCSLISLSAIYNPLKLLTTIPSVVKDDLQNCCDVIYLTSGVNRSF